MSDSKNWVVIYDIRDKKRLYKVAKILESYGIRVQKSVFELIAPKSIINEMRKKLKNVIDTQQDYIVYFDICEPDWQKRIKIGIKEYGEIDDKPFYIM